MLQIQLADLTLEAFGKYLSGILKKLVAKLVNTSLETCNCSQLTTPVCKKLEKMIQEYVPTNLANLVTEILMGYILMTYNNFERDLSKKRRKGRKSLKQLSTCYKHITTSLCSAVLHPSVNTFKFSRLQFPQVNHLEAKIFTNYFLSVILKKLSHIRCLKLEIYKFNEQIIQRNIKMFENLEELVFFGCSDAVMEVISNSCRKLRSIDLSNSARITHSSVDSILRLRNLEHLKILRTDIRSEGIELLFHGDSNFKEFNSLYCFLEPHHLELVPKSFSNLSTLEFCVHERYSLLPLKGLKNLKNLGIFFTVIHGYSAIDFKEFLQSIGPQLISLKLHDFREAEFIDIFGIIAENCTRLENLILKIVAFYISYEESDLAPALSIPVMSSVKFCSLTVSYTILLKALLPKLVNVKILKCTSYDQMYVPFVMELLSEMKNNKYDKLILGNSSFQVSGDNVVVRKCNGSYIFAQRDDNMLKNVLEDIQDMRTFDFGADCFQEIAKYFYSNYL